MHEILWFIFGLFAGGTMAIILMSMLAAGKKFDIESEKQMSYKEGYQKGFDDGYELQKSHTK